MKNISLSTNNRFEEIDVAKGIAIVLVVLGHVLASCYGRNIDSMPYASVVLWKYVYSFHMPLFMFISGFVVFNPFKKYKAIQIGKRCLAYMIPYIVLGLLSSYYQEVFNLKTILGQYWYFRTLVIFLVIVYLLDSLIAKFIHNKRLSTVITSVLFSAVVCILILVCQIQGGVIDLILDSSHMRWMYFYFILGWFLRRNERLYSLCQSDMLFAICFLFMVVHVVYPKNGFVCFQIAAIIFVINLSRVLGENRLKKHIVNFGKRTKDIYVLHVFFMLKLTDIGLYFERAASGGIGASFVLQAFIGITLSLIITSLSYKVGLLLNRNKYISQYCFGYLK